MKIKNNKGFTMIELVLVIAIAVSIIVVSFFTFQSLKYKTIANDTTDKIQLVISNYKDLMNGIAVAPSTPYILTNPMRDYMTKDIGVAFDSSRQLFKISNEVHFFLASGMGGSLTIMVYIPQGSCTDFSLAMLNQGFIVMPNGWKSPALYFAKPSSSALISNPGFSPLTDWNPGTIGVQCNNENSPAQYKGMAQVMVIASP